MKTLIQVQQEYMDTVSAGIDRWSHRRDGGHSGRIRTGAFRKAHKALMRFGFTDTQSRQIIRDAHDVMMLDRAGVDDTLNFSEGGK